MLAARPKAFRSRAARARRHTPPRRTSECLQWILEQIEVGMHAGSRRSADGVLREAQRRRLRCYRGFPKSICTSINEVICHGIPSKHEVLKDGDTVGIDVTLIVDGFYGDNAATVPVGTISDGARKLLDVTLESLRLGIEAARANNRMGDVGHAIQSYVEPHGFSVVRDFVGHGIGREFHEPPQVMHYGRPNRGERLRPGMTFTIEPMVNEGVYDCPSSTTAGPPCRGQQALRAVRAHDRDHPGGAEIDDAERHGRGRSRAASW